MLLLDCGGKNGELFVSAAAEEVTLYHVRNRPRTCQLMGELAGGSRNLLVPGKVPVH